MARRLSLSDFRKAIREVVHDAEIGEPTVLTHYGRDVAAIIPMSMFDESAAPAKKHLRDHSPRQHKASS